MFDRSMCVMIPFQCHTICVQCACAICYTVVTIKMERKVNSIPASQRKRGISTENGMNCVSPTSEDLNFVIQRTSLPYKKNRNRNRNEAIKLVNVLIEFEHPVHPIENLFIRRRKRKNGFLTRQSIIRRSQVCFCSCLFALRK